MNHIGLSRYILTSSTMTPLSRLISSPSSRGLLSMSLTTSMAVSMLSLATLT